MLIMTIIYFILFIWIIFAFCGCCSCLDVCPDFKDIEWTVTISGVVDGGGTKFADDRCCDEMNGTWILTATSLSYTGRSCCNAEYQFNPPHVGQCFIYVFVFDDAIQVVWRDEFTGVKAAYEKSGVICTGTEMTLDQVTYDEINFDDDGDMCEIISPIGDRTDHCSSLPSTVTAEGTIPP